MRLRLPRRPAIVLATAVLLSTALSAQPAKLATDRDSAVLARLTDDARVGLGVPGLSAAVASGEAVGWAQGFGTADLEDPIQRFVPAFPRKPQGEVRVRHLLTHTSGIRHYRGDEFGLNDYFPTLDRAIAIFRDDPLEFAPGERYLYSTYGYNLLAGVVEAVSGLNAPYADLSVKWAGGGIISTAGDLLRFAIALDAGRLLRPDTQDRMYTSGRLNSGANTGYGLGWMVNQDGGRLTVAHSGGAMGGTTYLLREPKARQASVLLANLDNVPRLRELADQLIALAPRPVSNATG